MEEKELYPSVENFIKKEYNCFQTWTDIGIENKVGYIDVLGVFYTNPEKTAIESIGIEVKKHLKSKSTEFGQAKGYSIFAHRIYFASQDEFNNQDIEIAQFLGIGLISITKENSNYMCHVVLESPL